MFRPIGEDLSNPIGLDRLLYVRYFRMAGNGYV